MISQPPCAEYFYGTCSREWIVENDALNYIVQLRQCFRGIVKCLIQSIGGPSNSVVDSCATVQLRQSLPDNFDNDVEICNLKRKSEFKALIIKFVPNYLVTKLQDFLGDMS